MTAYEMRISDWSSDVCSSDLAALPVDRADPIAVAVESQSKIEAFVRDEPLQVGQILLFGGIGMMIGEMTVHLGEDRMVLTRQQLHELLDHRAGGAVAREIGRGSCRESVCLYV